MVMLNANYIDEIKPEDCEYEVVEHLNRSTSLQGYTDPVNYSDLKTLFGKPSFDTSGILMRKSRLSGVFRVKSFSKTKMKLIMSMLKRQFTIGKLVVQHLLMNISGTLVATIMKRLILLMQLSKAKSNLILT